jgi:hypothetical protein
MSVFTTITPNGTGIKFQSHRPRGYFIMPDATPARMLDDDAWKERLDYMNP